VAVNIYCMITKTYGSVLARVHPTDLPITSQNTDRGAPSISGAVLS
jgi:hypothetical protein